MSATLNESLYGLVTSRTSGGLYGRRSVWMRILFGVGLSAAALGLVACGGEAGVKLTGRAVTTAQWKAVMRDWYDGRISDRHSCGAVVLASSHLPVDGPIYSTVAADLARYAAKVCTQHPDLAAVKVGTTDADVAALAGAPQMPAYGSCWGYPSKRRNTSGLAVCFRRSRVVRLGRLYHWQTAPAPSDASCDLTRLHATVGLQGATGSMLGGITLNNPGPTCTLAGRPVVELEWHGTRVTPPQQPFGAGSLKSMGPFHLSRTLARGKSAFVWLQWMNYCGAKPWGTGSFRPVAILRVKGEPGSVRATFRDAVVPPYCNSPRYSRFSVSDFGTTP
jgi:hypothetical protein